MSPETREALRLFELAHLRYQEVLRVRIEESKAHLTRLRTASRTAPFEAS